MVHATLVKYLIQFIFLFTGVFSTCAAQYVYYQGAGDQKVMLLPLCNYLGMMLVGLVPTSKPTSTASSSKRNTPTTSKEDDLDVRERDEPECTQHPSTTMSITTPPSSSSGLKLVSESMELIRRAGPADEAEISVSSDAETDAESITPTSVLLPSPPPSSSSSTAHIRMTSSRVHFSMSALQLCIVVSVILDFSGCLFSNMGLAMAGSGLYQVLYSSVICWSALLSRAVLKKVVSKEEWTGIAMVTFGLAFSALGGSSAGRNHYVILMGCLNTLIGAAFYGGNYVTGEYTLKLPERPEPKELCLKIGTACFGIIAIYQLFFVLPVWHDLVTAPIEQAQGNSMNIMTALLGYTLSQLAHGFTYFMMLGSSGAVTTGIMQSLRAVCVFFISSVLYCSQQESQCFDTKRGVATLIVISGVMFYSWAKSQATQLKTNTSTSRPSTARSTRRKQSKLIAGKNFVV